MPPFPFFPFVVYTTQDYLSGMVVWLLDWGEGGGQYFLSFLSVCKLLGTLQYKLFSHVDNCQALLLLTGWHTHTYVYLGQPSSSGGRIKPISLVRRTWSSMELLINF